VIIPALVMKWLHEHGEFHVVLLLFSVTGAGRHFVAPHTVFMTCARFAGVPGPALQVATFKERVKCPWPVARYVQARNRSSVVNAAIQLPCSNQPPSTSKSMPVT
jgi:hypothetical protein